MKETKHRSSTNVGYTVRDNLWKFLAYPFIATVTVITFFLLFFYVMPQINNIGLMAFSSSENVLFNYYVLPFTCIDMSIALGYYKLIRKFAMWVCTTLKNRKSRKDSM